MCGIAGLLQYSHTVGVEPSSKPIGKLLQAMGMLQHRGQNGCGIAFQDSQKHIHKFEGVGLVSDVFKNQEDLTQVDTNMVIGHLRYPTSGKNDKGCFQPILEKTQACGIEFALSHNGNITNTSKIAEILAEANSPAQNFETDSELVAKLLGYLFDQNAKGLECQFSQATQVAKEQLILKTLDGLHSLVEGAFSLILMIKDYGLAITRDSFGIRPLVYANSLENQYFAIASESVALDILGFQNYCDVLPGSSILIDSTGYLQVHGGSQQKLQPWSI